MIQDILPHRYHVAYQKRKAKKDDIILFYGKSGLLCKKEGGEFFYPSAKDVEPVYAGVYEDAEFLFCIDHTAYFDLPGVEILEFGAWEYLQKKDLRTVRPVWKAYAGITGFQIHNWRMDNRFCGRCGNEMRPHERERAMQCVNCGKISYPLICPSVIVGIMDGDKLLMTKYANGHSSFKKYALVAGYAEVGESLEDTVRREVFEEVGLRVKNIRYYKSQPWSFTDSLLAGFFCEVDGTLEITMDKEELSAAEWFDRKHLPPERSEAEISLTGEMINAFRDGFV